MPQANPLNNENAHLNPPINPPQKSSSALGFCVSIISTLFSPLFSLARLIQSVSQKIFGYPRPTTPPILSDEYRKLFEKLNADPALPKADLKGQQAAQKAAARVLKPEAKAGEAAAKNPYLTFGKTQAAFCEKLENLATRFEVEFKDVLIKNKFNKEQQAEIKEKLQEYLKSFQSVADYLLELFGYMEDTVAKMLDSILKDGDFTKFETEYGKTPQELLDWIIGDSTNKNKEPQVMARETIETVVQKKYQDKDKVIPHNQAQVEQIVREIYDLDTRADLKTIFLRISRGADPAILRFAFNCILQYKMNEYFDSLYADADKEIQDVSAWIDKNFKTVVQAGITHVGRLLNLMTLKPLIVQMICEFSDHEEMLVSIEDKWRDFAEAARKDNRQVTEEMRQRFIQQNIEQRIKTKALNDHIDAISASLYTHCIPFGEIEQTLTLPKEWKERMERAGTFFKHVKPDWYETSKKLSSSVSKLIYDTIREKIQKELKTSVREGIKGNLQNLSDPAMIRQLVGENLLASLQETILNQHLLILSLDHDLIGKQDRQVIECLAPRLGEELGRSRQYIAPSQIVAFVTRNLATPGSSLHRMKAAKSFADWKRANAEVPPKKELTIIQQQAKNITEQTLFKLLRIDKQVEETATNNHIPSFAASWINSFLRAKVEGTLSDAMTAVDLETETVLAQASHAVEGIEASILPEDEKIREAKLLALLDTVSLDPLGHTKVFEEVQQILASIQKAYEEKGKLGNPQEPEVLAEYTRLIKECTLLIDKLPKVTEQYEQEIDELIRPVQLPDKLTSTQEKEELQKIVRLVKSPDAEQLIKNAKGLVKEATPLSSSLRLLRQKLEQKTHDRDQTRALLTDLTKIKEDGEQFLKKISEDPQENERFETDQALRKAQVEHAKVQALLTDDALEKKHKATRQSIGKIKETMASIDTEIGIASGQIRFNYGSTKEAADTLAAAGANLSKLYDRKAECQKQIQELEATLKTKKADLEERSGDLATEIETLTAKQGEIADQTETAHTEQKKQMYTDMVAMVNTLNTPISTLKAIMKKNSDLSEVMQRRESIILSELIYDLILARASRAGKDGNLLARTFHKVGNSALKDSVAAILGNDGMWVHQNIQDLIHILFSNRAANFKLLYTLFYGASFNLIEAGKLQKLERPA